MMLDVMMLVVGDIVSDQLSPDKGPPTGLYQYHCLEVRVLEPPAEHKILHDVPVPEYHARSGRRDAFDARALEGWSVAAACSKARIMT